ncbi:hypothetical protein ACTXT7_015240 [Hymenolepis weldensis]
MSGPNETESNGADNQNEMIYLRKCNIDSQSNVFSQIERAARPLGDHSRDVDSGPSLRLRSGDVVGSLGFIKDYLIERASNLKGYMKDGNKDRGAQGVIGSDLSYLSVRDAMMIKMCDNYEPLFGGVRANKIRSKSQAFGAAGLQMQWAREEQTVEEIRTTPHIGVQIIRHRKHLRSSYVAVSSKMKKYLDACDLPCLGIPKLRTSKAVIGNAINQKTLGKIQGEASIKLVD